MFKDVFAVFKVITRQISLLMCVILLQVKEEPLYLLQPR